MKLLVLALTLMTLSTGAFASVCTATVWTNEKPSDEVVLTNYEIKRLAQYAKQLEEHYGKPQDIEFAIEGKDIYIVQSRPITTLTRV